MVILQCDDAEDRAAHAGYRCADCKSSQLRHIHWFAVASENTGGAILETSTDPRSILPDGSWHPAGENWQASVRTNVTTAMTAVELQSDDSARLAQRWSEVLEIPLGDDTQGNPVLKLENADLRFVPAEDGRGEGLGGLDLQVADRGHILREATARGCDIKDDTVLVCGTRFRLR